MLKFALWICMLAAAPAFSDDKVLRIYHDANWANSFESAQSIWQGMNVALAEENYRVQGYRIEPVKKNHSANVKRSRRNLTNFLNDPHALLVMGGGKLPCLD